MPFPHREDTQRAPAVRALRRRPEDYFFFSVPWQSFCSCGEHGSSLRLPLQQPFLRSSTVITPSQNRMLGIGCWMLANGWRMVRRDAHHIRMPIPKIQDVKSEVNWTFHLQSRVSSLEP